MKPEESGQFRFENSVEKRKVPQKKTESFSSSREEASERGGLKRSGK